MEACSLLDTVRAGGNNQRALSRLRKWFGLSKSLQTGRGRLSVCNPNEETHQVAEADYIQSMFQNHKSLLVQGVLGCGDVFLRALVHIPGKINTALWLGAKRQRGKVTSSTPGVCPNGNHLDTVSPGVYKATQEHMMFQERQRSLYQTVIPLPTRAHLT